MTHTSISTWNPEWPGTKREVFRDFGFAAYSAQMLENSLVKILLTLENLGHAEIQKPKKKLAWESEMYLSEKTLGALFVELRNCDVEAGLIELMEDSLAARNSLMHRFFCWNAENFKSESGRRLMLKELEELRFRIGRVEIVFRQILEQLRGMS